MIELNLEDVSARIPHRYQNLLLDKSTILTNNASEFELHLTKDDPMGRDIFFYKNTSQHTLPTPILAEISALACIVSSGAIEPGTFAYFASINNFKLTNGPFNATRPIKGSTQKLSDKNGFHKYSFQISNEYSEAQGQLMAFYDTSGSDEKPALAPITLSEHQQTSLINTEAIIPAFDHKNDAMTFINQLHLMSAAESIYAYTYPNSHPLVKGHFPNNPVMMGVCQWQMVEDAFFDLSKRQSLSNGLWELSAVLFKSDLSPVCDVKNIQLRLQDGEVTTENVKKVMFKQRVFPNDQIFVHLSAIKPI